MPTAGLLYHGDAFRLATEVEQQIRRSAVTVGGVLNDHLPGVTRGASKAVGFPAETVAQFVRDGSPPPFLATPRTLAGHLGVRPVAYVAPPPAVEDDRDSEEPVGQDPPPPAAAPPDVVLHLNEEACARYVRSRLQAGVTARGGTDDRAVSHTFTPETILSCLMFAEDLRPGVELGRGLHDAGRVFFGAASSENHLRDLSGRGTRNPVVPSLSLLRAARQRLDIFSVLWERKLSLRFDQWRYVLIDASPLYGFNFSVHT